MVGVAFSISAGGDVANRDRVAFRSRAAIEGLLFMNFL
jgi:hypothetical protein